MIDYRSVLRENAEENIAKFSTKLIPGGDRFMGVRIPVIRKLAKEIANGDWRSFIGEVGEEYGEYVMLHGMVIGHAKMDMDERLAHLRDFIPKVRNWAVCDTCQYKAKAKEREQYWEFLRPYLGTPSEFGMRFAVIALLSNFIDTEHIDRVLDILDRTKHDGYYLKMGVAWTVSVCFVKFPERTMEYLKNNKLDDFTYNKSLQKIVESFRVDDDMKNVIRRMKRKRI
jgi:3-methyladenine DNA glycosylase AlkD